MRASTIDDNVVHGYSYNNIVEIYKNICTTASCSNKVDRGDENWQKKLAWPKALR